MIRSGGLDQVLQQGLPVIQSFGLGQIFQQIQGGAVEHRVSGMDSPDSHGNGQVGLTGAGRVPAAGSLLRWPRSGAVARSKICLLSMEGL